MVRKKIDNRIRVLIENGVKEGHRTLFAVVGDKGRDQVNNHSLVYLICSLPVYQHSFFWNSYHLPRRIGYLPKYKRVFNARQTGFHMFFVVFLALIWGTVVWGILIIPVYRVESLYNKTTVPYTSKVCVSAIYVYELLLLHSYTY